MSAWENRRQHNNSIIFAYIAAVVWIPLLITTENSILDNDKREYSKKVLSGQSKKILTEVSAESQPV